MLGSDVRDPDHGESEHVHARGLQLLPIETELSGPKRLARVGGRGHPALNGFWSAVSRAHVDGYAIHVGRTRSCSARVTPLFDLDTGHDGNVSDDGLVAGTYLHGILEQSDFRCAVLRALARRRGFAWTATPQPAVDPYDQLASMLADSVRFDGLNCRALLN